MNLYERVEPKEGELVQFLGVYNLRWPWHSGVEPTEAFNQVDDPLYEAAPDLLAACKAAYNEKLVSPRVAVMLKKAIRKARE